MKTLSLGILAILVALAAWGLTASAAPGGKIVTYHLELKEFPERYKPTMEAAMEELVSEKGCWAVRDGKIEAQDPPSSLRCSRVVHYKSLEPLKPWKRNPTDWKYSASYEEERGEPGIRLQLHVWDGNKLRRHSNSRFRRVLGSDKEVRDLLVKWASK